MHHASPSPRDAQALDDDLAGRPVPAACPGVARVVAALRAADPAAGAAVPGGLAARALARVEAAGDAGSAVGPGAIDAWLSGRPAEATPAGLLALGTLLDAGAGDAALAPAPAGLVERALARVEADRRAEALAAQLDRFRGPAAADRDTPAFALGLSGRIGPGLRGGVRQALAAAAVVMIGTALLLPALRQSATEAGRLACLGNLREAGGAFARYAADFDGVLPRAAGLAGFSPAGLSFGAADRRESHPPLPANPAVHEPGGNGRHLGLLVTSGGGYLPAEGLLCHGQPGEDAGAAGRAARTGWRMPGSAAYSYQSQAGPEPLVLEAARPDLGILADRNPLFVVRGGGLRLRTGLPAMMPSRLHRGEGQNVLSAAGDARWTVRPRLGTSVLAGGAAADHLWSAEGGASASSLAPADVTQDAVLLP